MKTYNTKYLIISIFLLLTISCSNVQQYNCNKYPILNEQGTLMVTWNFLDFAIGGKGFFQLTYSNGNIVYTRDGRFYISEDSLIAHYSGYHIYPSIKVLDKNLEITVSADGMLTQRLDSSIFIGQLQIALFNNPSGLDSLENNIYQESFCSGQPDHQSPHSNGAGMIYQGYLEANKY